LGIGHGELGIVENYKVLFNYSVAIIRLPHRPHSDSEEGEAETSGVGVGVAEAEVACLLISSL
jgi:hypothetical protein